MRILFLHEVGYFEKPVFEMHEFPEGLSLRGHEVAFLDFPSSGSKGKQLRLHPRRWKVYKDAQVSVYSLSGGSLGIFGRLAAAVFFPIPFVLMLNLFRPDVVVSYAVPTFGWQSLIACKIRGIPFVLRAIDVTPKIRRTIFSGLISIAERFIFRFSQHVSVNGPGMESYALSKGARPKAIQTNLPPLDTSTFRFSNEKKASILQDLALDNSSNILLFMGTLFRFAGLRDAITEFSLSSSSRDSLVIVGGGEIESELRRFAPGTLGKGKILFTGFVTFERLSDLLSIADVCINTFERNEVTHHALPHKVLQYMACSKTVVSTRLLGLTELLETVSGKGVFFEEEAKDVVRTALHLCRDKEQLADYGRINRHLVELLFDEQNTLISFDRYLRDLADAKS